MTTDDSSFDLAVDAALAVINRFRGPQSVWTGPREQDFREQIGHVIHAAMDLGSDYGPAVWDEAEATLERLLIADIPKP